MRLKFVSNLLTGVILRAIGCRLVVTTGESREANWFRQNLAIAVQRGNGVQFSFSREGEGLEGRAVEFYPTPHFVPREFPIP